MGDTNSEDKFIPRKKPLSRRVTGYTPPTKSLREKARERYYKARNERKKCRESIKSPEACKSCTFEKDCPSESTEDWINEQKEKPQ